MIFKFCISYLFFDFSIETQNNILNQHASFCRKKSSKNENIYIFLISFKFSEF